MRKRKKKKKEKRREEKKEKIKRKIVFNRMKFAIGFGHPIDRGIDLIDRGIEIDRIDVEKSFREKKQNQRRAGGKLFGPRKSRCVNFLMQTYSKR